VPGFKPGSCLSGCFSTPLPVVWRRAAAAVSEEFD
jgi:hypothetical protein